MNGLTRFVLKRPITTLMAVLCLIVFGYTSVTSMSLENIPDMEMPVLMVMTTYSGASPEDVNEIITKPIEDQVGTLSGLKSVTSNSSEGSSMVMLEYEYGTDTDEAYDDLKKKVDLVKNSLPDSAGDPMIMEMDMNSMPCVTLSIGNTSQENLYSYVEDKIQPEFEKIAQVADVSVRGGSDEYIKIQIIPEKLSQYKMTMASVAADIAAADISYPSGDTQVGSLKLSVSTRTTYDTVDLLKEIPLTSADGSTVYLEDVADVYTAQEENDGIARYNGNDTVSLSITKQQSETAVSVSNAVKKTIANLEGADENLHIITVRDDADSIISSLKDVAQTLVLAIIISMIIIWLFFGDLKASLIVGTSIPISILSALILMSLMGFTLNTITMSALTLGVGMMVDNSIVVLESCFRMTAKRRGGFVEYMQDALEGTSLVWESVLGGTATTCVVFLPLAFLQGMTGQMFKPLGFTIVFCMAASLISSITIVPLCYMAYKPTEKLSAPFSRPVKRLQEGYRKLMSTLLYKSKTVMLTSIALLVLALFIGKSLKMELMAADDEGEITVTVDTRPGLQSKKVDEILKQVEAIISQDENLDSYMTSYGSSRRGGSSATVTGYLKDDRTMATADVASKWQQELSDITNCDITAEAGSSMSMMSATRQSYEVILKGTDYDEVKEVTNSVVEELKTRDDVTKIHSDVENSSPVVEVRVDALKAKSAGLTPSQIATAVSNCIDGVKATTIQVNGEDIDVKVQYAEDEYKSIDQVRGIVLTTGKGGSVALSDVADVKFVDSPSSVARENKEYTVTISAEYTEKATQNTRNQIQEEVVKPHLTSTVSIGLNSRDQSRNEEFASLFKALAIAVFLIFVVMAAQFESIKFSGMVMTTIPFSLIGAFGLLWLTDCSISMVSLIGFLMLIGTVVNNGILFVDTANQYRGTMNRDTALIEAGATRIRPILMTTLTTVVSMIPMAFSGTTTKSLAIVDIGGLTASTILCLLMLPVYYRLMSGREKPGDLEAPAKKRKRTRENIMNKIKGLFAGFSKKGNKKDNQ